MMRAAVVVLGLVSVSVGQQLNTILPRGAQRGTELDVSFVGSSLENPVKVLMERGGIQVLEIEGVKSNRVRVRLRIAADCSLGAHPMILVTKHGMTRKLGSLTCRSIAVRTSMSTQRCTPPRLT